MFDCRALDPQLGNVGKANAGDSHLIRSLLHDGYLPIVSSIGCDSGGNLLNVNADQAAPPLRNCCLPIAAFLSDVQGVLDGDGNLVGELTPELQEKLVQQQVIKDGMLVKVQSARTAATSLGHPVTIASWKEPEALLNLHSHSVGTKVSPGLA